MLVGGFVEDTYTSDIELFPRPPASDTCSVPDLPHPRIGHSLSLLSGGRLVVCGGASGTDDCLRSCISWVEGNTKWTSFNNIRWIEPMLLSLSKTQP